MANTETPVQEEIVEGVARDKNGDWQPAKRPTPAQGHVGFDKVEIKGSGKIPAASFFHQLHHRYFECNYGENDFPFDYWFGTFHDGSPESHASMREKRKQIHQI